MSIETTHYVKRADAIEMLREKGVTVFVNDCNDRLARLLYEFRESIFENYYVINDNVTVEKDSPWKLNWSY